MRFSVTSYPLFFAATLFAGGGAAHADEGGGDISKIAVRNPTGEYWSVAESDDGEFRVFADAAQVGPAETFFIVADEQERWRDGCLPNGARVLIKTGDSQPWSVSDRQLSVGTSSLAEAPEKAIFTLINETDAGRCFRYGDKLSIISAEDYYLSASPGGIVDADQKQRGGWEVFDLVDPENPPPASN